MATWRQQVGWLLGLQAEPIHNRKPIGVSPQALAGSRSRLTQDAGTGQGPFEAFWGVAARPDREVDWRALNLDARTLDRIGTADLVRTMADLSPEISGALWHFIRFCNPG